MIRNYKNKDTERIANDERTKAFSGDVEKMARRRLALLDAAVSLDDLKVPPSNRLEKLRGDRNGQYSIRINQQYRICFRWADGDAYDVEIVDYHD